MEDVQDLTEMEMTHHLEEHGGEKGAEPPGERPLGTCGCLWDSYLHQQVWSFILQERRGRQARASVPPLPVLWPPRSPEETTAKPFFPL